MDLRGIRMGSKIIFMIGKFFCRARHNILYTGSIVIIAVAFVLMLMVINSMPSVASASTASLKGWAWSSAIGWISFSSTNCDANNNGLSDGSVAGCPVTGTPIPSYGVKINLNTAYLSGYAWSSAIGWISFNGADTGVPPFNSACSSTAQCVAKVQKSTDTLIGWARALNGINSQSTQASILASLSLGGIVNKSTLWDGWIHLSGKTLDKNAYKVTLNTSSKEFQGWAWGSTAIGWISFNCNHGGTNNTNVCSQSQYSVVSSAVFNNPPSAHNLKVTLPNSADYCGITQYPPVRVGWTFTDIDHNSQSAYEIQVMKERNKYCGRHR